MKYLSASKLKSFRACPYQYKNQQFKRSEVTDFGNAVHAGLAAKLRGGDFWEAYLGEAGKLGVPLSKKEDAQTCLEFADTIEIPDGHVITIESDDGEVEFYKKKFFQVAITSGWGLRGAMDAVYIDNRNRLTILDWKTGLTKEEDDLQLALYALAAWKKYKGCCDTIVTKFAYVQQGFTQTTVWDEETLVGAFEYVNPLVKSFLQAEIDNVWKQTPHSWCKHCEFKDGCDAYNKQLTTKVDVSSYDVPATLENLPLIMEYHDRVKAIANAAYAVQSMMKEKYETILSEHGKQNIDGRTYEVTDRVSRYNYNLPVIFQSVSEMINRPPLEMCEFSKKGCDTIRKELEKDDKKKLDAILEQNREVKSTARILKVAISKEFSSDEAIEVEVKE